MHSSGSITRKLGPSWKQSTGQTSTQSVYLHFMHASVTTKVMSSFQVAQLVKLVFRYIMLNINIWQVICANN